MSEFEGEGFASNASFSNPIDLTASATTDEFVRAVERVTALRECDLALVLPTHQAPGMDYDVAERLGEVISRVRKPVASCVIGNSELASRIQAKFMAMHIPSFPTPERAVRALAVVPTYASVRGGTLWEVARRRRPHRFSRRSGPLPPREVSSLLRSCGLREPASEVVSSARDIEGLDASLFPAACKLISEGAVHKSDLGGVEIDVPDVVAAGRAFARFRKLAAGNGIRFGGMLVQSMVHNGAEVILGGPRDPVFGPVVGLGVGGRQTELIRDFALAVAPVTSREARRMMNEGSLRRILGGYRGGPRVSTDALAEVVCDFSRIMVENPQIEQMEVNPLMATKGGLLSVDARVILKSGSGR